MTSKLEQEFYDTFGIEPKHNDGCKLADNYWNNENLQKQYKTFDEYLNTNCTESNSGFCYSTCDFAYDDLKYPDIIVEKLLEIICIINKSKFVKAVYLDDCNYIDLENTIIKKTITIMKNEFLNKRLKDEFKQQIQQLFKD